MSITFNHAGKNYLFKNPSLGNVDELAFQRVNRRTRGGDLILFRDADWPKTEVQNLTFEFLKEADYRGFLNFLRDTFGSFITYTDHENKTWSGIIQNPETEGTQTGRSTYQVQIAFEGDLI